MRKQVQRGQSRWCLLDLHNLSLSHTHTQWHTHTGDIIAACQVCSWWPAVWHWLWAVRVCIPCSLCVKGAPYSLVSAASLALNHRTRWCMCANTHMHAHIPPSAVFLSGRWREWKEVKQEDRGREANERGCQCSRTFRAEDKERYLIWCRSWDKKIINKYLSCFSLVPLA